MLSQTYLSPRPFPVPDSLQCHSLLFTFSICICTCSYRLYLPVLLPEKINYDLLKNRARQIFYITQEIANKENRIAVE